MCRPPEGVLAPRGGRPGAGPDPDPPPRLPGAKMFERSRPSYKPNWRNWLAPRAPENFGAPFKGAGRTGHPCVYTQNAEFFLGIFPGPQEGRICAATSDFVATLIFPCHGVKWGQMSFVAC